MQDTGFFAILIGVALYGLVHSLLAGHALKHWIEQTWGIAAQRFYRIMYVLFASVALLPLLAMAAFLPDRRLYQFPAGWMVFTLLVQAAAGLGLLRAVAQTGAWEFIGLSQIGDPRPLVRSSAPQSLVTGGFYRYVRHPIYSFSFILLWLMPYMSWNILALVIGLSVYMLAGIYFEERKLVAEFGEAYRAYRRRTRALIPWIL
jgi:protein-S-isoprenylcysteine O-methyltransferase Ste14